MKTRSMWVISAALVLSVISPPLEGQSRQKKAENQVSRRAGNSAVVQLFNGKDLSNWVFKLKDPAVDPAKVFTVQNGVINISGNPFGYMRTKESYSNYILHVEYRWPSEATNSGVFIHAQAPDSIWLECIECQLQAGNAGDFICMNGSDMNERKDKSNLFVKKLAKSSEKPVGEWNTMEITCQNKTIDVHVNGVLQNKGTGVNPGQGSICLQSEGKDVQFRNVYLTKLPMENRR
jgi:hypothetical protein